MHKEYTVNRNNNKKLESMSMDNTYNNQNLQQFLTIMKIL